MTVQLRRGSSNGFVREDEWQIGGVYQVMFTLAHLSDPHLAPLPQPSWRELSGKRMTGYINWRRNRRFVHDPVVLAKIIVDVKAHAPDHIAVTGDVANIGLKIEFERGREWLDDLGADAAVSFTPGNHDIYVPEAAAFAARYWAPYMSDDSGGSAFPYVRRRGPLALIGLSSAVATPPFLATGRIGHTQLAALDAILAQLKRDGLFRVVMVHHPPVSAAKWHKRLLDAPALLRVIAAQGTELLIHGHDHLHMINWLDGPQGGRVPAVGVPSASAATAMRKQPAAYNLYRVDGSPGAWTCELTSRGVTPEGEVKLRRRMMLVS
jgi:3',5'-cyclic AMP phosphodiesterase CpdA